MKDSLRENTEGISEFIVGTGATTAELSFGLKTSPQNRIFTEIFEVLL